MEVLRKSEICGEHHDLNDVRRCEKVTAGNKLRNPDNKLMLRIKNQQDGKKLQLSNGDILRDVLTSCQNNNIFTAVCFLNNFFEILRSIYILIIDSQNNIACL